MKIRKILLRDNCDSFFTDLITFQKDTTEEEIFNTIVKCKNEIEDYTNEDIYNYLDKYIGVESIEFLDYKVFEY